MPPPKRQVYGRSRTVQQILVGEVFGASSPMKPSDSHEAIKSSHCHENSPVQEVYQSPRPRANADEAEEGDSDIEVILQKFGDLNVDRELGNQEGDGEEQETPRRSKRIRKALSEMSVNEPLETPPSTRNGRKLADERQESEKQVYTSGRKKRAVLVECCPPPTKLMQVVVAIPQKAKDFAFTDDLSCGIEKIEISPVEEHQTVNHHEAELLSHTRPLLSLCGDQAGQSAPANFQDWADSIDAFFTVSKIAEASYGEVYRLSVKDDNAGLGKNDESVLKIMALKPPPSVTKYHTKAWRDKVHWMSDIEDVAGEVRLLQRMSAVPGFTNFREVKVLQGRLPTQLVTAWRRFDKEVKQSEFLDPGRKTTHDEDQLWAIVEMQDAGSDLEHVFAENVWMCWDIFWGVACALAKGEEWARYEHRDLHLGNVCIRCDESCGPMNQPRSTHLNRKLGFTGLETTIIDYTLSRADMESSSSPLSSPSVKHTESPSETPSDKATAVAYFDLNKDSAIFEGNSEEEYQYDIYRHMRSAVYFGDPCVNILDKQKTSRSAKAKKAFAEHDWSEYHPLTNVVWLHFLLYKIMESVEWPTLCKKTLRAAKRKNKQAQLALELEERLGELQGMLELEGLREGGAIASAGDLVAWAIEGGWLGEEDVIECGNANV